MPPIPIKAQTEGSSTFDPDSYLSSWGDEVLGPLYNNNFRAFIGTTFGLKPSDTYGYKATSEVTLLQAQTYLEYGGQGGLHGWYKDAASGELVSLTLLSLQSVYFLAFRVDYEYLFYAPACSYASLSPARSRGAHDHNREQE